MNAFNWVYKGSFTSPQMKTLDKSFGILDPQSSFYTRVTSKYVPKQRYQAKLFLGSQSHESMNTSGSPSYWPARAIPFLERAYHGRNVKQKKTTTKRKKKQEKQGSVQYGAILETDKFRIVLNNNGVVIFHFQTTARYRFFLFYVKRLLFPKSFFSETSVTVLG